MVSDVFRLYSTTKQIFTDAGMNLREWSSNCPEFLNQVPEPDVASSSIVKGLGLIWNTVKDTIELSIPDAFSFRAVSMKHQALQCLCTIFDPLWISQPSSLL